MDLAGFFSSSFFFFLFCEFARVTPMRVAAVFAELITWALFFLSCPSNGAGAVSLDFPSHGVMGRDDAIACFFRGFSTS